MIENFEYTLLAVFGSGILLGALGFALAMKALKTACMVILLSIPVAIGWVMSYSELLYEMSMGISASLSLFWLYVFFAMPVSRNDDVRRAAEILAKMKERDNPALGARPPSASPSLRKSQ